MKLNCLTKIAPVLALTASLCMVSFAQTSGPAGGTPPPPQTVVHVKHPMVQALANLNLTTTQKSQIMALQKERRAEAKAFRKANPGDLPAIKEHNKQAKQTFMTHLKSVLTPQQWQQFQANVRALRGKHAKRAKKTAPPTP